MKLLNRFSTAVIERFLRLKPGAKILLEQSGGAAPTEIDLTELAAINSIGAADLAKIDGITNGTGAAAKALVLDTNGRVTVPAGGQVTETPVAASTGANLPATGISTLGSTGNPTFALDAPFAGAQKKIMQTGSSTSQVVSCTGAGATINSTAGTTHNTMTFDSTKSAVSLVGLSTAIWQVENFTSGITFS